MKRLSQIGTLLKKIYRQYSNDLTSLLMSRGFIDLRPSFLEVLIAICEDEGLPIKLLGQNCGLKKQTMTTHLNELEKRGYIIREVSHSDKREQKVFLSEYGQKFRLNLLEVIRELEQNYCSKLGDLEVDRIKTQLENFHLKIGDETQRQESFL